MNGLELMFNCDDDILFLTEGTGMYSEAASERVAAEKEFNLNAFKVDSFLEAVEREFQINLKRGELKCMEDGGTQDDYFFFEDAAEDGAVQKLRVAIGKIIAAFKQFAERLRTQTVSKLCSAQSRSAIATAEKKIKLNPILRNKKMEVRKIDKPLGVIKTYKAKADSMAAKYVKGILKETTRETLLDTRDAFRDEFKSATTGTAAVTMMTVGAIVAALDKEIERLPTYTRNVEVENVATLEKLQKTVGGEASAALSAAMQSCANFRAELAKEEMDLHVDRVMSMITALKKAVSKAKGNTESKLPKSRKHMESAEDDALSLVDEFLENSDFDMGDEEEEYDESGYEESEEDFDESEDEFGEGEEDREADESSDESGYEESFNDEFEDIFGTDLLDFNESSEDPEDEEGEEGEFDESANDPDDDFISMLEREFNV